MGLFGNTKELLRLTTNFELSNRPQVWNSSFGCDKRKDIFARLRSAYIRMTQGNALRRESVHVCSPTVRISLFTYNERKLSLLSSLLQTYEMCIFYLPWILGKNLFLCSTLYKTRKTQNCAYRNKKTLSNICPDRLVEKSHLCGAMLLSIVAPCYFLSSLISSAILVLP